MVPPYSEAVNPLFLSIYCIWILYSAFAYVFAHVIISYDCMKFISCFFVKQFVCIYSVFVYSSVIFDLMHAMNHCFKFLILCA